MTHDQINEMPAGPELDALACAAVGWIYRTCETPSISIDITVAMAALEKMYSGRITHVRSYGWVVSMLTHEKQGDPAFDVAATADTAPLAIARALAKLGATR